MTDNTAEALAPIVNRDRIKALDVVRGFALLGIFLMNVEFFSRPLGDLSAEGIDPSLHGVHWLADALIYFFVQSKFWTLFSILFGMGFAVMIDRARRAGRSFLPTYLRRSLALLGIGCAHALLIWSGDILVSYALAAMVMLLARQLRRWLFRMVGECDPQPLSARTLAICGAGLFSSVLLLVLVSGSLNSLTTGLPRDPARVAEEVSARADERAERAIAVHAYSVGTYQDAVRQRVVDTNEQLDGLPLFLPFLLGAFLIGAALIRSGWLADPARHAQWFRRGRNFGLPVGFALMALSTALGTAPPNGRFGLGPAIQMVTYLLAGLVLALAYGATLVILLNSRCGRWLGAWLAPAGRMALSNYLMQSLIGTLLFYGYGLGLWGKVGRAWQVLLVLSIYSLQLGLSRWWLARFNYGPMEWLWRAITYWQLPAMRRLQ
jgi:uncharacterized protein